MQEPVFSLMAPVSCLPPTPRVPQSRAPMTTLRIDSAPFARRPCPDWRARVSAGIVLLGLLLLGGTWQPTARAQSPGDSQSVAEATGSGPLETSIEVQKLVIEMGANGSETRRWVAAARLNAGDEIHYTVRVRNPGKAAVENVVVTKRLPFGVHYLRNSAAGPAAEVQFSIDGGKTFATEDALARAAGGAKKGQRRPLDADYTHVRWVLRKRLGPASTALLRFRAKFS
jgi:uncharacterized repeat protein (TIGR01451 family)